MKSISTTISRCFILAITITTFVSCGDPQNLPSTDSDFNHYLETGELQKPAPGAPGSGSECGDRVLDKVCATQVIIANFGSYSDYGSAYAAELSACQGFLADSQADAQALADAEKSKCEEDQDNDGIPDCEFWSHATPSSCTIDTCKLYVDGGGDNQDTICTYNSPTADGAGDGTCRQVDSNTISGASSAWKCSSSFPQPCFKTKCQR